MRKILLIFICFVCIAVVYADEEYYDASGQRIAYSRKDQAMERTHYYDSAGQMIGYKQPSALDLALKSQQQALNNIPNVHVNIAPRPIVSSYPNVNNIRPASGGRWGGVLEGLRVMNERSRIQPVYIQQPVYVPSAPQPTEFDLAVHESRQKVYQKYPEFYAMVQGVVAPSREWIEFDKVASENPWLMKDPKGPEIAMEMMEKNLGITDEFKKNREESIKKVYNRYPEFYAMINGVVEPSREFIEFDRIALQKPELVNDPRGPEKAMEEMERNLGISSQKTKPNFLKNIINKFLRK